PAIARAVAGPDVVAPALAAAYARARGGS
ncbi:MAG: hypothetical protein JWN65_38, partial [Solirubrobacterales bacterium]|nr:hypothetical protein [Solirubrobacterales bacterium]